MNKTLTDRIKISAKEAGFDLVGIASAAPTGEDDRLRSWLDQGCHASMSWMENHIDKRLDPTRLMPGAQSIVVLAMNYYPGRISHDDPSRARISRYALSHDYHRILKKRALGLLSEIKSWSESIQGRFFVDTAPIMEKFWAVQAGLGGMGKQGLIVTREFGSWVFLGEILLNIGLKQDEPQPDCCGSCRLCIDACPTRAIIAPYVVDANRCLSYLTIEHRGEIPPDAASEMGNRIFGCDICQEVCPWNIQRATVTNKKEFLPNPIHVDLQLKELADFTEEQFRQKFGKSPIKRAKFDGFQRNVRIGLRNAEPLPFT
ncbi:MAG: tRNA epoxyqueuosine(34) reductase QueG [Candidatus Cloacimonetes bacterium 4572_55]|nr:MAG: tRNA epoxyqueuosine(34) reductase QueG [Candidatus Cloacimonetes bacterium 4572_55]